MAGDAVSNPYDFRPNPLLVVISGASGVGKDTVISRFMEHMGELGNPFHFVVTATSRPPRAGEVHGADYFFVSEQEFERMIEEGELFEHAVVYGQYKGVPKAHVREAFESGRDVLMRLDVQGALTVRKAAPEAVLIFLSAVSEQELKERLRARSTEGAEQLETRLQIARDELKQLGHFDYVVFNKEGELEEAVRTIAAIIRAEKCRVRQRVVRL